MIESWHSKSNGFDGPLMSPFDASGVPRGGRRADQAGVAMSADNRASEVRARRRARDVRRVAAISIVLAALHGCTWQQVRNNVAGFHLQIGDSALARNDLDAALREFN